MIGKFHVCRNSAWNERSADFHETRMAEHGDETRKSKRAGRLKSADSILQSKRERHYPRCIVAHCG